MPCSALEKKDFSAKGENFPSYLFAIERVESLLSTPLLLLSLDLVQLLWSEGIRIDAWKRELKGRPVAADSRRSSFKSSTSSSNIDGLSFSDRESKSELSSYFDVEGITLVILAPDGKTLTATGRRLVDLTKQRRFEPS
ncbi:hypothetical protein SELMODRAFT_409145 [Selaginella moellendorffii]|uniref:Uncharacterized protein n=1 Tax=Selaginella moellendorffii TaxID=88036 RepID=D8RAI1_SELML|nr:hypothetical protein SELMODRAFT_409145 [Selaginella moellendorffii]